jgi:hypothetical protein
VDELAGAEIADCEKAKMHAPARRNSKKPVLVEPGDLAVDIKQFLCKQVGTGSLYDTLGAMLCYRMVFYESHGTEKSGFEYTMRHMHVSAGEKDQGHRWIDVAKGRIFSTFGAASPSATAQFKDDEGEVVDYLHSDYDSGIKGFTTRMVLT